MSNTAVIILTVILVFAFFFILRASGNERDHRVRNIVSTNGAMDGTPCKTHKQEDSELHMDEHQIERWEVELQMSEFGFQCARQSRSKEAAYAQAEPVLMAFNSRTFEQYVHVAIDDFIESHGQRVPAEQYAACQVARHEREQFQITHELPLMAFGESETYTGTTAAEEMDLVQQKSGKWVERFS